MARTCGLGWLVVFVSMAGCGWRAGHQSPPDAGPIFTGDASVLDAGSEAGSDQAVDLDGSSPEASQDAGGDGMVDVDATSPDAPDGDVGPDRPDAFAPVRVWTEDSSAIDVSCQGHHEGQMRFLARRDQLSADELALLANVTTAPPQPGLPAPDACVPDLLSCTVTISGAGGASASYFVWAFDSACGGHDNLLADSTFRPFRNTLPCRYGLEVGPGSPPL